MGLRLRLGLRLDLLRKLCFAFHLGLKFYFFGNGWGGRLEKVKLKLNSTQVVVEVEVRVELGKSNDRYILCASMKKKEMDNVFFLYPKFCALKSFIFDQQFLVTTSSYPTLFEFKKI